MNKWKIFRKIIVSVCLILSVIVSHTLAKESSALLKIIPEKSGNEMSILIKYESNDMCGGSFNFIYDTKILELISVEGGETIEGITHFVNSKYADGVIRINWASTTVLPAEGTLINIKLKMLNEFFDSTCIGVDKLKIVNGNNNKIPSDYQVKYTAPEQNDTLTDKDASDSDSQGTESETDKDVSDGDSQGTEFETDKDVSDGDSQGTESETDKDASDGDSQGTESETDKDASDGDSQGTESETDKELSDGDSQGTESETDKDVSDSDLPSVGSTINNSGLKQQTDKTEDLIEFADVNKNDWFYKNIQYVIKNKLMNGVAEGKFAPDEPLTRSMLVTVLYRNSGEPDVNNSIPFADVDMGTWYTNAVVWARQNGIVKGINETEFAPDANITREQIAVILFRYAWYKNMDTVTLEENLQFTDTEEISEYAVSAINWAVGTGLMKGRTVKTINPQDNATRAEIAAILQRFVETNK